MNLQATIRVEENWNKREVFCYLTYLTQLTQSEWAFLMELVLRFVMGSNNTTDFFSHAATSNDLKCDKFNYRKWFGGIVEIICKKLDLPIWRKF